MPPAKRAHSDSSSQAIPKTTKRSRPKAAEIPLPDEAASLTEFVDMTNSQVSAICIYLLGLHLM